MDLSRLTAPTRTLEIDGQRWTFSPLSLQDNEELILEMKAGWPSPLAAAEELLKLPLQPAERTAVLEMAFNARLRPRFPTTYEFDLWKKAGANVPPRIWQRRLRRVHSAITEAEAFRLYQSATPDQRREADEVDEVPLGNSQPPETGAVPSSP